MKREARIILSVVTAVAAIPLALLAALMIVLLVYFAIRPDDNFHHENFVWSTLLPLLGAGLGAAGLIWFSRWIMPDYSIDRTLCTNCGYDLRGSKTCCPECGKMIARPTTTSESKDGRSS